MKDKFVKRATTIGRLVRYASQPALYPRSPAPFSFWWHADPNFGDRLTPMLLPYYGIAPILRGPSLARLFGVGSLINGIPNGYDGWIWGTGAFGYEDRDLSEARTVALRGPLTRELLNLSEDVPLGDPGLLVSRVIRRRPQRWRLGVVAHKMHVQDEVFVTWRKRFGKDVTFVDVTERPESVVSDISQCAAIVSTSLHGVITADSYGIPAAWSSLSPIEGGDFKFRDHDAAMGAPARRISLDPDDSVTTLVKAARVVDSDVVEERIIGLERVTHMMREEMLEEAARPLLLWKRQLRG